jgi:hypothetical protein
MPTTGDRAAKVSDKFSYIAAPYSKLRAENVKTIHHSSWPIAIFRLLLVAMVYVIVASYVLDRFMSLYAFLGDSPRAGLNAMVDGTAARPFVYRVMVPAIVRVGSSVLEKTAPEPLIGRLAGDDAVKRYTRLDDKGRAELWTTRKLIRFHVAYLVVFASLVLALLAGRYLLTVAHIGSTWFRDFAPAIALLFLPPTMSQGAYMYDAPELAFLLGLTALAIAGRWTSYYLILPFAILNKESNILLVGTAVALAAGSSRWSPRRAGSHAAMHALIGLPIVIAVRQAFAENPGTPVEDHLRDNFVFWTNPKSYLDLTQTAAALIPMPGAANILMIALAAIAVFAGWLSKPPWLRRLTLVMLTLNLPLLLLFSYRDEFRNLSLAFPALFLCAAWVASHRDGWKQPRASTANALHEPLLHRFSRWSGFHNDVEVTA